eukprot:CAMPEP_0181231256 /NCGR_PEP_ID=MMETSP1096-20121128/34990_1 /TAXON_ID=156174 ORGANISM="Chrysochromulina ericina, Strain CCMP281" /NCGR_SAMPLE_ID=MMETSP1096 /ASSEMBLY_ACC=CAM_ASM_000453 /LENGTH=47 /DNA_ID= /DNA_START= /DNA_END= /DNA_ORIENTATION=
MQDPPRAGSTRAGSTCKHICSCGPHRLRPPHEVITQAAAAAAAAAAA